MITIGIKSVFCAETVLFASKSPGGGPLAVTVFPVLFSSLKRSRKIVSPVLSVKRGTVGKTGFVFHFFEKDSSIAD